MNHITQEQLVELYYGEPQVREVEQHFTACEQCRAEYQTLKRVLNSVEGFPVPEPVADYEAKLWRRVAPAIGVRAASRTWFQWRYWVPAAAIAAMLVVAFLAGRVSKTSPLISKAITAEARIKGPSGEMQSIPVLVIAVGDHLERLQAVLAEIENADPHRAGGLDISFEQQSAEDLLDSNRLFRQTATAQGDLSTASVLEDVERVLLEITHQPAQVSAQQLEDLRRDIADGEVVFKTKVLGTKLRGEMRGEGSRL